jgi:hypothetical protein
MFWLLASRLFLIYHITPILLKVIKEPNVEIYKAIGEWCVLLYIEFVSHCFPLLSFFAPDSLRLACTFFLVWNRRVIYISFTIWYPILVDLARQKITLLIDKISNAKWKSTLHDQAQDQTQDEKTKETEKQE